MHGDRSAVTPDSGSESEKSECVQALRLVAPESEALTYGDIFEDTPSERQFFAHESIELEDSGDEDWVPRNEKTSSKGAGSARSEKSRSTAPRRSLDSKSHVDCAFTSTPSQLGVLNTSPPGEAIILRDSEVSEEQMLGCRSPSSPTEASPPRLSIPRPEEPYTILEAAKAVPHISKRSLSRGEKIQATDKMASRGRPEYRQAILDSCKPRTSFAQNTEETISVPPQSRKRNQHDAIPAGVSYPKYIYTSDNDSDVEVTTIKPRKGRSAKDPVEVDSGDEAQKVPAKNGDRFRRWGISSQRGPKTENERPVAYFESVELEHAAVDLTMLPTSDSSGMSCDESSDDGTSEDESDGIICIGRSDRRGSQVQAVNNQHAGASLPKTRARNHTDDSSDSNDEGQATEPEQNITSTESFHLINGAAKSGDESQAHVTRQATASLQIAPWCSAIESGDDGQETAVDERNMDADNGELGIPKLEMFYSHEAPLPFTLKRAEELARARDESARQEHEAANRLRWLNGEPYMPFPEPATKCEHDRADERKTMMRARHRKLIQLARATIRTSVNEGISPQFIRRRDHESEASFAARLLKFKVAGWKKWINATRLRRRVRLARTMRAALVSAKKQKVSELGKNFLEREAFDTMMSPY